MIVNNDLERISDTLAILFSYGFEKNYSLMVIQKNISNSKFINDLENGKYSFTFDESSIIKDVYSVEDDLETKSIQACYFAEVYVNLFFKYKKSFEYLFSYLPLELMFRLFPMYHEMDISQMWIFFEEQIKKETLLKKLSKKRQIKLTELSLLLGIEINTLKHYSMSDASLFNASFKNIFKLARFFEVKESLFIDSLEIYYDPIVNKNNLNNNLLKKNLGLYFAQYYNKSIRDENFSYDIVNDLFYSKKSDIYLDVITSLEKDNLNKILLQNASKSYIVIFNIDNKINEDDWPALLNSKIKDVFVFDNDSIVSLRSKLTQKIPISVEKALVSRAKSVSKYLD